MAKKKLPEGTNDDSAKESSIDALSPDEGVVIPRIALKETGFLGLKTSSGLILQDANHAFRFPQFFKTIAEMDANPTIGSAMNVYRFMITRPKWSVKPPVGADEKSIERARIVGTMMDDMEDSWDAFMHTVVSYLRYGHSIHNIVPYRRLKRNGSLYNDGLVGIRKLAFRNQETIVKWVFDPANRDLLRVEQSPTLIENSFLVNFEKNQDGNIELPRDSFLLFTASNNGGNPQGTSIYRNIYLSYKQLTMLQDNQLLSVAKSSAGVMKIEVPAQYLQGDKSPDKGAAAEAFKAIIDGHNAGTNRGLLVPQQIDPDSKNNMFNYSLMEEAGGQRNNVESIIKGLQDDIYTALSVNEASDGETTNILEWAVASRLKEIRSVLNKYLMRKIFELNGWDVENMPTFEYSAIEKLDVEKYGKFIQQTFSVSALEVDRPVMNRVREIFGVPPLPDEEDVDKEKLPSAMSGTQTNAAEGMRTAGDGTRKSPMGAKDASAANANNK